MLCARNPLVCGLVAALSGLASTSVNAATPPLAPGVTPAADLSAPATRYVVANSTPIYRTPAYDPSQETGATLKRGEHPQILGEANMGGYLLVGRGGKGIGYVSRALMCPEKLCPDIKG